MDSSLTINNTSTGVFDLHNGTPFSRFFKTIRSKIQQTKLVALRQGIKALLLIDVLVGLWLAATYIYVFQALSSGGMVGEPDLVIARTEFWLSIGVTCWFLWQVPFWVIRLLKGSHVLDSAQTVDADVQEKDN